MRKIDLKVPTGWNQCTKEQLEAVARIILRRTMMQDRYHPYDPVQMKAEAFFALAGLTVLDKRTEETEDDVFLCSYVKNKKEEPFPLAVWQVHSFIDQHLKWLDEFTGLLLFPYHDLGHYWRVDRRWPWVHRCRLGFEGELLDGMTWQQYRFAQEWLSYYVDVNGQLAAHGVRNNVQSRTDTGVPDPSVSPSVIIQGAMLREVDFSFSLYAAYYGTDADIIDGALKPIRSKLKLRNRKDKPTQE